MILGKNSRTVKRITALHSNKRAKLANEHLVEGEHSVFEYILHVPENILIIVINESKLDTDLGRSLARAAQNLNLELFIAPESLFKKLVTARNLETCLCVASTPVYSESMLNEFFENISLMQSSKQKFIRLLILDGVSNPTNTGALFRLARSSGMDAVIMTGNHVFPFAAHCVRASQGASAIMPLYSLDTPNLLSLIESSNIPLIVTDVKNGEAPWKHDFLGSFALVMGSEARGAGPELLNYKKRKTINIPMHKNTESLSVVQAASMILYEHIRQLG